MGNFVSVFDGTCYWKGRAIALQGRSWGERLFGGAVMAGTQVPMAVATAITGGMAPVAAGARMAQLGRGVGTVLKSPPGVLAVVEGSVAASGADSFQQGVIDGAIAAVGSYGGARAGMGVAGFFVGNQAGKVLIVGGGIGGEVAVSLGITLGGSLLLGRKAGIDSLISTGVSVSSATALTEISGLDAGWWGSDTGTRLGRGGIGMSIGLLSIRAGTIIGRNAVSALQTTSPRLQGGFSSPR
jgi:hypothetical protein